MMRVALCTSLLLLLTGCSEPEAPPTVAVRAVFLESLFDGQAARFDHEAVPGWMDAMRMPFPVDDPSVLDGMEPGTKVVIALDTSAMEVLGLTRLPADAVLTLASRSGAVSDSTGN